MSETLAAWENGTDRTKVTPKEQKRVYTALHQSHLPSMDRNGILEYDTGRGTVTLVCSLEQFHRHFSAATTHRWGSLYLALDCLLGTVVVLAVVGFPVLGAVSGYAYAAATIVLFTAFAAYHSLREHGRWTIETERPPEASTTAGESGD